MRKIVFFILILLSTLLLFMRLGAPWMGRFVTSSQNSGVRIESKPEAVVYIDGVQVGKTPHQQENFLPGKRLVELRGDGGDWQGYVNLHNGTISVVNRELSSSPQLSSGEVITLEKGQGATVISQPQGAQVELDGEKVGVTPLQIEQLTDGEHRFVLSKTNYLSRSIRAVITKGFRLNLNVDLSITEADLTKLSAPPIQVISYVVVKATPTGFLRVRSAPSVSSSEVGRVTPGQKLVLLEEQSSWVKVRLENQQTGYVSSSYVEKQSQ